MMDPVIKINADHKLRAMAFEDIYIFSNTTNGLRYHFTDYSAIKVPLPRGYQGPPPDFEVNHVLKLCLEKNADEFDLAHDGLVYRGALLPAKEGVWFVLRRAKEFVPELTSFGGVAPMLDALKNIGQYQGLVIATGPTGGGKTNFIGALTKTFLTLYGGTAVTIESPPELPLEGEYPKGYCYQMHFAEKDFPLGLQKALRYRPRYIMVGELRTQAAALTAINASLTGHTVLTTVHGGSIAQCLINLVSLAAPHGRTDSVWRALAEGLQMVSVMTRSPTRAAPNARMLILPSLNNPMAARSKLRAGLVEQLVNDVEQQHAKTNARA